MTPAMTRAMSAAERQRLQRERPELVVRAAFPEWAAHLDQQIASDLATGVVETIDVSILRLGAAQPVRDEGPLLFCEIAGPIVVGLIGPWQFDPDIVDLDPDLLGDADIVRRFRLVRAPASGIALRIESLEPVEPIRASHEIDLEGTGYLPPTFVVNATLETVVNQLRARKER